jgi:hypothetical protein
MSASNPRHGDGVGDDDGARISRQNTREWENNEPMVAANSTARQDTSSDPSSPMGGSPIGEDSDSSDDPEKPRLGDEKKGEHGHTLEPINTNAHESILERSSTRQSGGSVWVAAGESMQAPPVKKDFWYKINPLKWNPPSIPVERKTISREYTANWFSRLTFQWMQPMMTVSCNAYILLASNSHVERIQETFGTQ